METSYLTILMAHVIQNHPSYSKVENHSGFADLVTPETIFFKLFFRSRNNGAIAATGDVVIFLDAHCEVGYNWLPPLLAPIHENRFVFQVVVVGNTVSVERIRRKQSSKCF
jgi:hypothetical protein